MFRRVLHAIERHGLIGPGQRVGVAVSGGADSVCLLHLLRELAPRFRWKLIVLHLDHALRGAESEADAAFVRELASRLGLQFVSRCEPVGDASGNLEQAGREARLRFFREAIESRTADRVATAHTRSDQAETVLFRMLRGSGTAGLAGIRPYVAPGIVRPMLEIDRAEVLAFLRERGIPWREDSTNANRRFARNRIRHDLIPQLSRDWNPNLPETLGNTARWALDEEAYWEAEVARLAGLCLEYRGGAVLSKLGSFRNFPVAAQRRLIRHAIAEVRRDTRSIDFCHIEAVLELLGGSLGHKVCDLPGVRVERSFDLVRFVAPGERPGAFRVHASVPGVVCLPGVEMTLDLLEKSETTGLSVCVYNDGMGLDWGRLSGELAWRNWESGDRYQPIGSTSERKIKTLFQEARIPFWDRAQWPILMDGGSIVWVRQFGPAAGFGAGPDTRVLLRIRERSCDPIEIGIGMRRGGV